MKISSITSRQTLLDGNAGFGLDEQNMGQQSLKDMLLNQYQNSASTVEKGQILAQLDKLSLGDTTGKLETMNSAPYSDEEVIVTGRRPTWQPQSDAVWAISQAARGIDLGAGLVVTIETVRTNVGTGNEPSPENPGDIIVTGQRTQNNTVSYPTTIPGLIYRTADGQNVIDHDGDGVYDEILVQLNTPQERRASLLARELTAGAARADVIVHGALIGAAGWFNVANILARLGLSASSAGAVEGALASLGISTSGPEILSQADLIETLDQIYRRSRYNDILQNPQNYEHYIYIPYTNTFYDSNEFDN
jgi:hypothetical protein